MIFLPCWVFSLAIGGEPTVSKSSLCFWISQSALQRRLCLAKIFFFIADWDGFFSEKSKELLEVEASK